MNLYSLPIYIWLSIFGSCIGSFLNVVVYRLPNGGLFSKSRSYCPKCKEQLRVLDLIPVFSYIFIKGRCRYCKAKISLRYPLVEIVCGAIAVLSFARFGFDYRTVISFGVCAILLCILLIDYDIMEIPNSLVISLIPFAVAAIWVFADVNITERLIGFFAVSLPLLLITLVITDAFGGGDIKLMAVCGFFLGYKGAIVAIFIALLLGGGYAGYLLISKKAKRGAHIAFGPYLCIGVAVSLFYGAEIVSAYLSLF